MKQADAYIHAMGHYHPKNILNNDFFDELDIGSDAQWVEDRTGIRSRHRVLDPKDLIAIKEGKTTLQAVRNSEGVESIADIAENMASAKQNCDHTLETPELVICGTSVPDYDIPANACTIAERLKWPSTAADANSACSSFVVDIHQARGLVQGSLHERITDIQPGEVLDGIDFSDRNSCVCLEMGRHAYIFKPQAGSLKVIDTLVATFQRDCPLVQIRTVRYFYKMEELCRSSAISPRNRRMRPS